MPQVVDEVETSARQRRTRKQTQPQERRFAPSNRPFVIAPDGYPAPTALEIEEGAAHLEMVTTRAAYDKKPESALRKEIFDEAAQAWNTLIFRLYHEEGDPATSRCVACHVVRFGRPPNAPCGHCGAIGNYWNTR